MTKIDWAKFTDPMVVSGVRLLHTITKLSYEAYIVGGAVRDIAMGDTDVHDIDIATNMPIDVIKAHFTAVEYGGGEKHGTVIVHFERFDYELTQFRTESGYSDKRRPDHVEFVKSFEEDTKRRDFTINSMGIDASGAFIDYHGGMLDIQRGVLRTVGDPRERFDEDALRILRAIRFAARFGFVVDTHTLYAIKELAYTVPTTSIERIRDELFKTIAYGGVKFACALELLQITGLWRIIIPEVSLTQYKIEAIRRADTDRPDVNFAILMSGLDYQGVSDLCMRLTFTIKEMKTIAFIVTKLPSYEELGEIPKVDALAIVLHSDFMLLRSVFISLYEKDLDNSADIIQKISKFKEVTDRQKVVNQIIQSAGFSGARFGMVVSEVRKWLFSEFEKDCIPTDIEIEQFVKGLV
jgi:hypothetical protein